MASWLNHIFGKAVPAGPLRRGWEVLSGYLKPGASGVWQQYSIDEQEGLYKKHELIYSCVNKIMTSVASVPVLMYRKAGEKDEEVLNHPMLDLLARPNSLYTKTLLVQYVVMRLLLTGKAFVWKWRNGGGRVSELWPVPSSWCKVKLGDTAKGEPLIAGFEVRQKGAPTQVEPKDMIYFHFPDPQSVWDGIGPLEAASRGYQLDSEQGDYLMEMLKNLSVPGLVLWAKTGISMADKAAIKDFVHDSAGRGSRGGIVALEGEGKLETAAPLADMDWPGFSMLTESRICAAFGVPPIIAGARAGIEKSTYANYETAKRSFWEETVVPTMGGIYEGLTRGLLLDEGEEALRYVGDTSDVEALQEAADIRTMRVVGAYQGNLIDRDEGRRELGYDEKGVAAFVKSVAMELTDEKGEPLSEDVFDDD